MQPDQHQDEQWQQPREASSQAPFQAPTDPNTSTATEPLVELAEPSSDEDGSPIDDGGDDERDDSPSDEDDAVLVRWEAPEYAQHDRGVAWYVVFGAAALLAIVVAILFLHSVTFAILVPVMAVALFIYTRRPPEVLHYTLSRKGLHVNDKLFPYAQFKSFGVVAHGGMHSVVLIPRKRFQLGQTLYFPESVGEKLVDMLASRLPMQEVELDAIDRLLARLHL